MLPGVAFYLNSYAPLVATPFGRDASVRFNLAPFIDGSIRREPDLEHPTPTISCLCRKDKFAPRLQVGDLVAYVTKQGRYREPGSPPVVAHHRLTAILRVARRFNSHIEASAWFQVRGVRLPGNCMVPGNRPCPVAHSHRGNDNNWMSDRELEHAWDASYQERADTHGRFVVCDRLWHNLGWDAPMVHRQDFDAVFGSLPGTRNPKARDSDELRKLLKRLRLDVPLSSP